MKLAIHQPHYLPWQGLLEKWRRADLLIVLDTVQFEKQGWQNRCKIRTPHGDQWLTVPVHGRGLLKDIAIAGESWKRTHEKTLDWAYGGMPAPLRWVYGGDWTLLADLAETTMAILRDDAGFDTPMKRASDLGVDATDPTERLIALCEAVGADTYLHGAGAAAYMQAERFVRAGIRLEEVTGVWPPHTALGARRMVAA